MKWLKLIFSIIANTYFTSADPNLFGSKKRRKEKRALSEKFASKSQSMQDEIDTVKSANPFESAAAKSAMARASLGAKTMQKRMLNTMGNNASAEAVIAAQGATTQALGTAAGQIATGAEAIKKQELGQLRGLKAGYEAQESGLEQAAINERGQGWRDFTQVANPLAGGIKGALSSSNS